MRADKCLSAVFVDLWAGVAPPRRAGEPQRLERIMRINRHKGTDLHSAQTRPTSDPASW
jgi:hypothetical protein